MNLENLIDQWIGEEKHILCDEYEDGYNQALQDLKSRKQELVEGIEKLMKEENEMNAREEAEHNDLAE
jgi:hypothetical protein